jgi:hypothetical protein
MRQRYFDESGNKVGQASLGVETNNFHPDAVARFWADADNMQCEDIASIAIKR